MLLGKSAVVLVPWGRTDDPGSEAAVRSRPRTHLLHKRWFLVGLRHKHRYIKHVLPNQTSRPRNPALASRQGPTRGRNTRARTGAAPASRPKGRHLRVSGVLARSRGRITTTSKQQQQRAGRRTQPARGPRPGSGRPLDQVPGRAPRGWGAATHCYWPIEYFPHASGGGEAPHPHRRPTRGVPAR